MTPRAPVPASVVCLLVSSLLLGLLTGASTASADEGDKVAVWAVVVRAIDATRERDSETILRSVTRRSVQQLDDMRKAARHADRKQLRSLDPGLQLGVLHLRSTLPHPILREHSPKELAHGQLLALWLNFPDLGAATLSSISVSGDHALVQLDLPSGGLGFPIVLIREPVGGELAWRIDVGGSLHFIGRQLSVYGALRRSQVDKVMERLYRKHTRFPWTPTDPEPSSAAGKAIARLALLKASSFPIGAGVPAAPR